jgi:lathosterol oxidase
MMNHPRFLKNQVKLEIQCSLRAFPGMTLLTLPWFQAEVRGYSKLYDNVDDYGFAYLIFSVPL